MSGFNPSPDVRPRQCVGSLLDIPFGRYKVGKYGDYLLLGGFSDFIGLGGRGNSYKTALGHAMWMRIMDRYDDISMTQYDSELTASWDRIEQLSARFPNIDYETMRDEGRIVLTDGNEHSGNAWWKIVREISKERANITKKLKRTTPFLDKKGNHISSVPPYIHFCDSLSALQPDAVEEIYEKNEIGDSGANTDALRGAAIKTQLIRQVSRVMNAGGMSLITTAHLGDEVKLDPYAPAKQQLAAMKKGLKFKNVPEQFTFLTSNCWIVTETQPLINRSSKCSEYPRKGFKDLEGDNDLQQLRLLNVRSKFGPTGQIVTLLVSQSEGLLPSLSEFHYLKSRKDKFGLVGPEGVGKDYRLAIYPDVLLKRTEVRPTIDNDTRLQRALEITSELCQIGEYAMLPKSSIPDPTELYENIKKQGYDWNVLLDTRGYWTYDHYDNPVPALSTMDLVNMYHGKYVPYWYDKKKSTATTTSKPDTQTEQTPKPAPKEQKKKSKDETPIAEPLLDGEEDEDDLEAA